MHTKGPLAVVSDETVTIRDKQDGGVASLGWLTSRNAGPRRSEAEVHANARLLRAAYNSYDRHCGERAVEAAEADLLGQALEALRQITATENVNPHVPLDVLAQQYAHRLAKHMRAARAVLALAKEEK